MGSFFRTNNQKNQRGNLNSKGMGFLTLCDDYSKPEGCCGHSVSDQSYRSDFDTYLPLYSILAQFSCLAAAQEMIISDEVFS